jgi:hypothetical protein
MTRQMTVQGDFLETWKGVKHTVCACVFAIHSLDARNFWQWHNPQTTKWVKFDPTTSNALESAFQSVKSITNFFSPASGILKERLTNWCLCGLVRGFYLSQTHPWPSFERRASNTARGTTLYQSDELEARFALHPPETKQPLVVPDMDEEEVAPPQPIPEPVVLQQPPPQQTEDIRWECADLKGGWMPYDDVANVLIEIVCFPFLCSILSFLIL